MPFKPGQSGNPNGRPTMPKHFKAAFDEMTPKAIETLAQLLSSPNDSLRLKAVREVLDRALGRPVQAHDLSGSDGVRELLAELMRPKTDTQGEI